VASPLRECTGRLKPPAGLACHTGHPACGWSGTVRRAGKASAARFAPRRRALTAGLETTAVIVHSARPEAGFRVRSREGRCEPGGQVRGGAFRDAGQIKADPARIGFRRLATPWRRPPVTGTSARPRDPATCDPASALREVSFFSQRVTSFKRRTAAAATVLNHHGPEVTAGSPAMAGCCSGIRSRH
jgi:hypothetical protein